MPTAPHVAPWARSRAPSWPSISHFSDADDRSINDKAAKVAVSPINAPKKTIKPDTRPSMYRLLRLSGCAVILGGSVVIFASVAFLLFLWYGGSSGREAANAGDLWRRIALDDRTNQAVTLVGVIIRTVVTYQAAMATSMAAGLILEARFVPRSRAAHFSMLRALSSGPFTLMRLILTSGRRKLLFCIETLLGTILFLSLLSLQFSSTILLFDLGITPVTGDVVSTQLQLLMLRSQQIIATVTHSYERAPPIFVVFGEVEGNMTTRPDANGFSSTGLVQRAFLPMSSSDDRVDVRTYSGQSTVLSTNVACMRPQIENLQYSTWAWVEWSDSYWAEFTGTMDYTSSLKNVGKDEYCDETTCPPLGFTCEVPGSMGDEYGWQSNMCFFNGVGGTVWSGDTGPVGTTIYEPWSTNSSINLLFSTNMRVSDWGQLFSPDNVTVPASSATPAEEWTSYEIMPGRYVNVSVCFSSFNMMQAYVDMFAPNVTAEPAVEVDPHTGAANTSSVRAYVGADPSRPDPGDRGILQIRDMQGDLNTTESTDSDAGYTLLLLKKALYGELAQGIQPNVTLQMCMHCTTDGSALNDDLTTVLEQTVQSSGRAADTMQAFVHLVALNIYHTLQKRFTGPQPVSVSSIHDVTTANGCRARDGCAGLITVATLLGVHLATIGAITGLYVARARFSSHSNVWHAVSQLWGRELRDTVEAAYDMEDDDVARAMKERDKDYFVRLGRSPDTQRVEIMRYRD